MSVSTAAKTRQSAGTVQAGANPTFRGIKNAFLLAGIQEDNNGAILVADKTFEKLYDLSDAVTAGTITNDKSRRVFEMSLPLKTNTLLFYGRAPQGEASGGLSAADIYGQLDEYTITETEGSALFQLGKRLQATSEDQNKVLKFKAMQGVLSGILTLTMNTTMSTEQGTHPSISSGSYSLDGAKTTLASGGYPNNLRWSDYTKANGLSPVDVEHPRYELENKLGRVFTQMTDIKSSDGEIRAASGEAILRTIQDLWTIINEIQYATPYSPAEAVAQQFAITVNDRLLKYFQATVPTDGGPVTGIKFKSMESIITAIKTEISATGPWPSEGSSSKPTSSQLDQMSALIGTMSLSDFPQSFGLPRGASYIDYNSTTRVFQYPSTFNTSGMGGIEGGGSYGAESYYYPAELLYFGNSPIRATDTEFRENQYPGGYASDGTTHNGAWAVADI